MPDMFADPRAQRIGYQPQPYPESIFPAMKIFVRVDGFPLACRTFGASLFAPRPRRRAREPAHVPPRLRRGAGRGLALFDDLARSAFLASIL